MKAYYKLLLANGEIAYLRVGEEKHYIVKWQRIIEIFRGSVNPQPDGCGGLKITQNGREPVFYDYEDCSEADFDNYIKGFWGIRTFKNLLKKRDISA